MKRIGGKWKSGKKLNKQVDGDKFICLDKIINSNSQCLIYSFGIANDWSFEDQMDKFGSLNFPSLKSKNGIMMLFRLQDLCLWPYNQRSTDPRHKYQILQDRSGEGRYSFENFEEADETN